MTVFEKKASEFYNRGICVFSEEDEFLPPREWAKLENIISEMSFERVTLGDVGEISNLEVARFMTDVHEVKVVDATATATLLQSVMTKELKEFYQLISGCPDIHMRRAQINRLVKGSFLDEHIDRDSNPDYAITVVLQFGHWFSGGEFVINSLDGEEQIIVPRYRSAIVARCDLVHCVKLVEDGVRTSLAYFLAGHNGPNRRYSM